MTTTNLLETAAQEAVTIELSLSGEDLAALRKWGDQKRRGSAEVKQADKEIKKLWKKAGLPDKAEKGSSNYVLTDGNGMQAGTATLSYKKPYMAGNTYSFLKKVQR